MSDHADHPNHPVRQLEPADLWNRFADLNAIPRPSKHEGKVVEWLHEWAATKGLESLQDEVGNVLIKKPATPGMASRKTVVLQSHVDMVCQKNEATEFDFMTQGIRMLVDGDWVRAEGTTLGADNGIGVASILAVLESRDIPHPALEALFTIDEETGMTGALGLQGGFLSGDILLNLDTEDDEAWRRISLPVCDAAGNALPAGATPAPKPPTYSRPIDTFAVARCPTYRRHASLRAELDSCSATACPAPSPP
ncbi:MAG: hypothetical protein ACPHZB_04860, partial [Flavobacteriales bacterium]